MSEVKKIATRESYGNALAELGAEFPNLVVLDADLAAATKTGIFKKAFPDECANLKRGEPPTSEKWIGFISAHTTIKKESNKWMNKYFIASRFIDQVSELPQSQEEIDNMEEEYGGQIPFDEIDFQGQYVEISSKAKECLNKIRAVKDE